MCGSTAREVYQKAFAHAVRQAIDIYAQLKAKGMAKNVKELELSKNFNEQRGRFASTCQGIANKATTDDERWGREMVCWWWLRRAATSGADELALLLGKVLRDYDPDAHKQYARAFPKPPAPKKGAAPGFVNPF
jgi:predicted HNH restriction endonuclease